ncbi:ROK family protein [Paraclostridium bifermentans]|jgi:glucokinase|uniref:ROK family protein n=1 Tax=Paraclostridium bifermentans TaxID=1490 RepID=UPI001899DDE9|nr:ROK family protein [Paraclostridium bifermentans]MBS5952742.1 ROK family protein [Paraclostridium bifermentans]MBU5288837.1 ROK family protein [Paraclostridium bifermentans]MDU3335390.1 ROK family protein [Paraclostridium bifermentans]
MYYIGVDIGGTGVQAGVVDENGQILFRKECPTDVLSGFEKIMEDINQLVRTMLEENGIQISEIKSIGFGVPSFINKKGQVTCVNLGWKEEDFINTLKSKFPETNVYAENDATVAALAEAKAGSMKGCDVGVMYTLGTGVGGGIIINGKVFNGAHNMGSEIGHVILDTNYFDCNCGNNGCLETFCSATAIIKYAKKLIEEGNDSKILELANNNIENINAKNVFDAYRLNDKVAIETINRFKEYLAKAIAGMINTLDPEVISLGGGVSRAGDIILDGLDELVRKYIIYKNEDFADIVIATLGADAGIVGAAFLS